MKRKKNTKPGYLKGLEALDDNVVKDKHLLIDLMKKIFELDPEKRISAYDALNHPFFDK